MTRYEIDILKQALMRAELEELERFRSLPKPEPKYTDDFKSNIRKLAEKRKTLLWKATKTVSRRVAVVLVAVFVTLCLMMSISAIRTPIVNFFVNVYENFIGIFVENDEKRTTPESIENISLPSYMMNGYSLEDSISYGKDAESFWSNEEGDVIILYQQIIRDGLQFTINNENMDFQEEILNGTTIHYASDGDYYQIYWSDEIFIFSLICPNSISFTDVKSIISSIK
ncbi:MAG: hypothetical protein J6B29_02605 [Clostridia bacterium]|nr:hypothetical protein [Clostridia bacterium]